MGKSRLLLFFSRLDTAEAVLWIRAMGLDKCGFESQLFQLCDLQ